MAAQAHSGGVWEQWERGGVCRFGLKCVRVAGGDSLDISGALSAATYCPSQMPFTGKLARISMPTPHPHPPKRGQF